MTNGERTDRGGKSDASFFVAQTHIKNGEQQRGHLQHLGRIALFHSKGEINSSVFDCVCRLQGVG